MDRRTLLAVILSVVVITIGFTIQSLLSRPSPEEIAAAEAAAEAQNEVPVTDAPVTDTDGVTLTAPPSADTLIEGQVRPVELEGINTTPRVYRNDLIEVTLDPIGGSVSSYRLLDHLDQGEPVDMVFSGNDEQRAFTLHFGDHTSAPLLVPFVLQQQSQHVYEFYRDFYVVGREDAPFRITKRFSFQPSEYMMEFEVEISNTVNEAVPLNFGDIAYTIGYGPQIGPEFEQLDRRTEFREYIVFDEGDRNLERVSEGKPSITTGRVTWAAVAGKYFAVAAVTGAQDLVTVLSQENRDGLPVGSQLFLSRPVAGVRDMEDTYRFYIGPKTDRELDRYDVATDNNWGISGLQLARVQQSRRLLGWLENILKWLLQLIYRLIPNYGVAIIITTIIVKLLLWPLMRKSYQSTARMQAINPKVQELREKYKDNQQKMNTEMAALYKKEGVSPLGGCLPMLAQFPFFLAMYGLFNNHFDLRGATFIPGWITDLSAPEAIFEWVAPPAIPLLGTAIRALPIIFVGTQLLSTKLTQTPQANQSNMQMKLMQYGLPIMFFFILYNVPSGLLVYWIFSNVITAGQQYYYNKIKKPSTPPPDSRGPKKRKRG